MKKEISIRIIMSLILLIILWPLQGSSQHNKRDNERWLSDKGFWMLEYNIKNPRKTIVYFYNNDKTLVYKELIEGKKLNLKRRKVLIGLHDVLEQAVDTWAIQHIATENKLLLATAFRKK